MKVLIDEFVDNYVQLPWFYSSECKECRKDSRSYYVVVILRQLECSLPKRDVSAQVGGVFAGLLIIYLNKRGHRLV